MDVTIYLGGVDWQLFSWSKISSLSNIIGDRIKNMTGASGVGEWASNGMGDEEFKFDVTVPVGSSATEVAALVRSSEFGAAVVDEAKEALGVSTVRIQSVVVGPTAFVTTTRTQTTTTEGATTTVAVMPVTTQLRQTTRSVVVVPSRDEQNPLSAADPAATVGAFTIAAVLTVVQYGGPVC